MNDSNRVLTAEYVALLELGPDPYPDLPVMAPEELGDGDVLMMLGEGWTDIGPVSLPVSWMIRALDGGAYSHSAMVSIIDGEPRVWDHSDEWALSPVSLEKAIRGHKWCHVYRLSKHGEQVGSDRYPPAPIVKVLQEHTGDSYDKALLLMAGVVAVISRIPKNPELREAIRLALEGLIITINWLLDHHDIRKGMLICTAVTGMSYWSALNTVPHDYALEVDIQRRQGDAGDEDWQKTIEELKQVLTRMWPEFPDAVDRLGRARSANAAWVEVGGPLLPVNMVAPSDLEFSRTLQRVGRLEIPR